MARHQRCTMRPPTTKFFIKGRYSSSVARMKSGIPSAICICMSPGLTRKWVDDVLCILVGWKDRVKDLLYAPVAEDEREPFD